MIEYIRTKEILDKFNITRQTLYNWVKSKQIDEPIKDWRGWRMWNQQHLLDIERLIDSKAEKVSLNDSDENVIQINNRRYLGSKHKLLGFINSVVNDNCIDVNSVADIFGGTGVVADMFYKQGKQVIVNDILYSNYLAYHTWFSAEKIDKNKIATLIRSFNDSAVEEDNYASLNFGDRYFSMENAQKIGFVREKIEQLSDKLNFREKAILITSLMYALDKVANTCGHYDAYRRKMDSYEPIKLLMPKFNEQLNENINYIYRKDANELVREIEADLVYIDTPYNSRQYSDAYHLIENIAEWKKGRVEGVAMKMVERKHIKSRYCTSKAPETFQDLIENIKSKYILVSYNNMAEKGVGRSNAKISDKEIVDILSMKGEVKTFDIQYNAFTTGKTNIEDHKEILYLCTCK
ncbi:DNA adenine methylase [Clostridium saccharoperbutylacetonicum]|uniref:DNA adenine methylase n=1 Tax=Clostridium saccharoperbutylacetonicum TaxID=36745 RepID=UPI0039E74686